jgi:hypothetical protein
MAPTKPMRSWPAEPAATSRASSAAASAWRSSWRADARKACPAGVSRTDLLLRSNRRAPTESSSWRIATDSGGCEIASRCAARPKCSSSASTLK